MARLILQSRLFKKNEIRFDNTKKQKLTLAKLLVEYFKFPLQRTDSWNTYSPFQLNELSSFPNSQILAGHKNYIKPHSSTDVVQ